MDLHNCDMNADCDDSDGSFTCTCREGYTGNGTVCTSKKVVVLLPCTSKEDILPSQMSEIVTSFACDTICVVLLRH